MRRVFRLQSDFERLKTAMFALSARRARPASVAFNGFKTLVQSFLMWVVFLGVGPLVGWNIESVLLRHGWPSPRFGCPLAVSLGLFCISWLVAWSSAWMLVRFGEGTPLPLDSTNLLVVRGPYRWVRNPMALASLLQGAAIGLWLGSPLVLFYVLTGAVLWNITARPWEERDLEARFGNEFRAYRHAVRCWTPRLRPYSPRR